MLLLTDIWSKKTKQQQTNKQTNKKTMWCGKQIKSHTLHSYLVSLSHPMPAACWSSYSLLLSLSLSVSLTMPDCSVKVLCDCAVQKACRPSGGTSTRRQPWATRCTSLEGAAMRAGRTSPTERFTATPCTRMTLSPTPGLPCPRLLGSNPWGGGVTPHVSFFGGWVGGGRVCVCVRVVHVSECVCVLCMWVCVYVLCTCVCVGVCMCVGAYLNALDVALMLFLLVVFMLIRLQ